jgi:hypothetical protein
MAPLRLPWPPAPLRAQVSPWRPAEAALAELLGSTPTPQLAPLPPPPSFPMAVQPCTAAPLLHFLFPLLPVRHALLAGEFMCSRHLSQPSLGPVGTSAGSLFFHHLPQPVAVDLLPLLFLQSKFSPRRPSSPASLAAAIPRHRAGAHAELLLTCSSTGLRPRSSSSSGDALRCVALARTGHPPSISQSPSRCRQSAVSSSLSRASLAR